MGGSGEPSGPLVRFFLGLTGRERPRVCFLPTAVGDSDSGIVAFYERVPARLCEPSHLKLFGVPRAGFREHLLAQDAIYVCWFECGVTDSFGPELERLDGALGFLAGSFCPHYAGEPGRRPAYERFLRAGLPSGYAADDGVGLHFVGTELAGAVTEVADADAYRVELAPGGELVERRLGARVLT